MTNDKREQARKYELYAAILERDANPLTPHGIANGLGAQLIRQRAAALLREAEADENNCPACSRYRGVINGRLCCYDPVEVTIDYVTMNFNFEYTNFKFLAEGLTRHNAALRKAEAERDTLRAENATLRAELASLKRVRMAIENLIKQQVSLSKYSPITFGI